MSVRRLLCGLVLFVSGVLVTAEIQAETPQTFTNPVIESGADPWVIRHADGWYYLCGSSRNEIFLVRSRTLTGLATGERKVVRRLQLPGPSSLEVWAPELHWLDNAWYIYFAASDGNNANHRMFVLENTSADPFAGSFTEKGKIIDRLNDDWAIDGTVLTLGQAHYFLWSGADATLNP